jgi:tetratricopeptide (TPR) repeat protein
MNTGQGKNTFKLIYEFNNDSSLFARLAAAEIENKEYKNAINILEKGIDKFPFYPTANFIYSIALAYQGKINEAVSVVKRTREIFPCDETIDFYLKRIDQINKDQNSFTGSSRFSFVPGNFTPAEDAFEDKLESIADQLSKAKIKVDNSIAGDINPREEEAPSKQIVSETMARIFCSQGKFAEAISMYEELIACEPDRKEYFQLKIDEIKAEQQN